MLTLSCSVSQLTTIALAATGAQAAAVPSADGSTKPSSPFHDCLLSGANSWADCQEGMSAPTKRGDSSSPFHDCLGQGGNWYDCKAGAMAQYQTQRSLNKRLGPSFNSGNVISLANDLGSWTSAIHCYKGDKISSDGWLTNNAVKSIAGAACSAAVHAATKGAAGTFYKKLSGFYEGGSGPVVQPNIKFFLSTFIDNIAGFNPDTLGQDLCLAAIDQLTGNRDCITAQKAGAITSHTSVNGGLFDITSDGAMPNIQKDGSGNLVCTNCVMEIVLEASNNFNDDGTIQSSQSQ
jgi:hypothetical protein